MERVVVISGTSKGIGREAALHFLAQGCKVYGCSRGEGTIAQDGYVHTSLDLREESAVRGWMRDVKRQEGRIDVLFCNAGYAPADRLVTMTSGDVVDEVLLTNVKGTFLLCREAAKYMMRQKSGRIITVSSMAAGLHLAGTAAYAMSKAAIVELTKILAKELAPFGVTCNAIAPSMYMTDGVEALEGPVIERALQSLTLKRTLSLEELLHVLDFFVADEASAVTGQVVALGQSN